MAPTIMRLMQAGANSCAVTIKEKIKDVPIHLHAFVSLVSNCQCESYHLLLFSEVDVTKCKCSCKDQTK